MKKRLIIDGSNALHRAYWIANNKKDVFDRIGTIFIFLKSLKTTVDRFKPDETWITWDKKIKYPSTNFRKELTGNVYKIQRDKTRTEQVHECHDKLVEWIKLLGVYQLYPYVLEADDVISWLTQNNKDGTNIIVSMDKDLLQLVSANTIIYNPIKRVDTTALTFEDTIGVDIKNYLYYKALLGDTSDNVEGIYGYGKQKSKKFATLGLAAISEELSPEELAIFQKNLKIMDLSDSFTKEIGEVECYQQQFIEQTQNITPKLSEFEKKCDNNGFLQFSRKINEWKDVFEHKDKLLNILHDL